jgi:hypothetical protein
LKVVKEKILNIRSLDLISPELLRSRNRSAEGKLGLGGENYLLFVHESGMQTKDMLRRVNKVYVSQLDEIKTKSLKSGWKQLEVTESFRNKKSPQQLVM